MTSDKKDIGDSLALLLALLILSSIFFIILLMGPDSSSAIIKVEGNSSDTADFLKELNDFTGGASVTISPGGTLSIEPGGNAFAARLREIITFSATITIQVGRNQDGVIGGAFVPKSAVDQRGSGTQKIDLDDKEKYTTDTASGNRSQRSLIIHELWEGYIALKDSTTYGPAHSSAIDIENEISSDSLGGKRRKANPLTDPYWISTTTVPNRFDTYTPWTKNGVDGYMRVRIEINGDKVQIIAQPDFLAAVPAGENKSSAQEGGDIMFPKDINDNYKTVFNEGNSIKLDGFGVVHKNVVLPLYVVNDVTITDGMTIPSRVPGTALTVLSDNIGFINGDLIWGAAAPGTYDILIDANLDGLYTAESDDMYIEGIVVQNGPPTGNNMPLFLFTGLCLFGIGVLLTFNIFKSHQKYALNR